MLDVHDFPGPENEILKLRDFPGFSQPIGTLKYVFKLKLKVQFRVQ